VADQRYQAVLAVIADGLSATAGKLDVELLERFYGRPNPDPPSPAEAARILNRVWADLDCGMLLWSTMITDRRRSEVSALRLRPETGPSSVHEFAGDVDVVADESRVAFDDVATDQHGFDVGRAGAEAHDGDRIADTVEVRCA
jgi:hypothetical protein